MVEEILFEKKTLNYQVKSNRPKIMASEAVLQDIDGNPTSSTQRVSGKLDISPSNLVLHFYNLSKSIELLNCFTLTKYCKIHPVVIVVCYYYH